MTVLTPEELADLWRVRFGRSWVQKNELTDDWGAYAKILLRKGMLDYESVNDPNKWAIMEVVRLKENTNEFA